MPLKSLQMLVGKLRHAAVILPAAKGFFTPINTAMRGSPNIIGLGAASELRTALEDIISLLKLLSSRPMHANELVPDMPKYIPDITMLRQKAPEECSFPSRTA